MANLTALVLGGVLGTCARYGVGLLTVRWWGTQWPWGTFLVNVTGCAVLGLVTGWMERHGAYSTLRLFAAVGFCGAFTTFSTLIFEMSGFAREGDVVKSCVYLALSVAIGFLLFRLGLRWGGL